MNFDIVTHVVCEPNSLAFCMFEKYAYLFKEENLIQYDIANKKVLQSLPGFYLKDATVMTICNQGRYLFVFNNKNESKRLDLSSKKVTTFQRDFVPCMCAIAVGDDYIYLGKKNNELERVVKTGKPECHGDFSHHGSISCLLYSEKYGEIYTGSYDGYIGIYKHKEEGKPEFQAFMGTHRGWIKGMAWKSETVFVTWTVTGSILSFWDIQTRKLLRSEEHAVGNIQAVIFPSNRSNFCQDYIVIYGDQSCLRHYTWTSLETTKKLDLADSPIVKVVYNDKTNMIAFSCKSGIAFLCAREPKPFKLSSGYVDLQDLPASIKIDLYSNGMIQTAEQGPMFIGSYKNKNPSVDWREKINMIEFDKKNYPLNLSKNAEEMSERYAGRKRTHDGDDE